MTKNYKNYYNNLENMDRFIKRSIVIDQNSKLPGAAKIRNFFRAIGNYLFGDHRWYSYSRARSVLKVFLTTDEKNIKGYKDESQEVQNKIKVNIEKIFEGLRPINRGKFVESLEQSFHDRFRTKAENPIAIGDEKSKPATLNITPPKKKKTPPLRGKGKPQSSVVAASPSQPSNPSFSRKSFQVKGFSRDEKIEEVIEINESPFVSNLSKKQYTQPEAPSPEKDDVSAVGLVDEDRLSKLPEVTARLLFHLQADEFGKNSELEGLGMTEVLDYLFKYMKNRKDCGGKIAENEKEIMMSLRLAHSLSERNLDPKIAGGLIKKAFQKKMPLLIPGGWVGKPAGHAIYYELIPNEDDTATLRLFNTGDGSNLHKIAKMGVKNKIRHTEWRGIAKDKLIDPHFLKALQELKMSPNHPETGEEMKLDYRDIYFGLKKLLGVTPENCIEEEITLSATLMQPQRAGVCAYRSLMAYLKTKMTVNEFRRFKCDIRIQSLTTFSEMDPINGKTENWRLVKKSFKQLCRKIDRLYQNKAVLEEYLESAKKKLEPVRQWYKDAKVKERQMALPPVPNALKKLNLDDLQLSAFTPIALCGSVSGTDELNIEDSPCTHLFESIAELNFNDPQTFQTNLNKAKILLQEAFKKGEFESVHFAAIEIIGLLSLDSRFLSETRRYPWGEKERIISDLADIARLLFDASHHKSDSDVILPVIFASMRKLIGLQKCFANFNMYPNVSYLEDPSTIIRFELHDEKSVDEHLQISKAVNQKVEKQNYFQGNFDLGTSSLEYVVDHSRFVSFYDFEQWISTGLSDEEARQVKKKIEEESKKLTGTSFNMLKGGDRYLAYFASDHLPDWVKSIRDTEIRLTALSKLETSIADLGLSREIKFEMEPGENRRLKISFPMYGVKKFEPLKAERKISDRMKPFQKESYYQDFLRDSEKRLLSQDSFPQIPNIDPEEIKEIKHLFLNPSTSIVETLEFFTRYPEKIRDPDYQYLFQSACFNIKAIKTLEKRSAALMHRFLTMQLDRSESEGDYSTVVFVLRMQRYLSHFKSYSSQFNSKGQTLLLKLLKRKGLDADVKTYLYTELAAYLAEKRVLDNEEIKAFLIATTWKEQHQLKVEWLDPKTEWEIKRGQQYHLRRIENYLVNDDEGVNQAALNAIFHQVRQEPLAMSPKKNWRIAAGIDGSCEIVFVSSDHDLFFPLKGRLYTLHQKVLLPYEIRNSNDFKLLFPEVKKGIAHSNGSYEFEDAFGNAVIIKLEDGKLIVEKQIETVWHRYIPAVKFENEKTLSRIQSRELINHYSHWQSSVEPGKIRLIAHGSDRCEYISERELLPQELRRIGYYLQKVIPPTAPVVTRQKDGAILNCTSSLFTHIEDPGYIHEWFLEERLVDIELPRLGLSFKADPQNPNSLLCNEYPGWRVAEDQTVPKMGFCKNFLVLEQIPKKPLRAGDLPKRQVLLPKLDLKINLIADVMKPKPLYERHLASLTSVKLDHYSFALDQKQNLVIKSRESALYLALTFAANQDYRAASAYLKNYGEKLSSYSQKEVEILQSITEISKLTRDTSGEIKAISLYACFLLTQNPSGLKDKYQLHKLYLDYLMHYHNVTTTHLTKDQELVIIKNALSKGVFGNDLSNEEKVSCYNRLKELDPTYAHNFNEKHPLMKPREGWVKRKKINIKKCLAGIKISTLCSKPFNRENAIAGSMLRPEVKLKQYLPEYIEMAINGSVEEKKWLMSVSHFLASRKSNKEKGLGYLLKEILTKSDRFTPPPKNVDALLDYFGPGTGKYGEYVKQIERWWAAILNSYSGDDIEETVLRYSIEDLTPPYLRLDEKIEKPTPCKFQFNYRPIPALSEIKSIQEGFKPVEGKKNVTDDEFDAIDDWLKNKADTVLENDALKLAEWKRLRSDLAAYRDQVVKTSYQLSENSSIKAISQTLKAKTVFFESQEDALPSAGGDLKKIGALKIENERMDELEKQMKELANLMPERAHQEHLRLWGGVNKKITLSDILVSFALKNPLLLQMKNRSLSQDNLDRLYTLTAQYLEIGCLKTQRERCLATYQKFKKASLEEKEDLQNLLAEQLHAVRCYDVIEHPQYLVFEHYAGIIMRNEQVIKLDAFMKGGPINPIMEMIMGSGKSKVLLPLLALMRANGKELSLLIVPAPLFESVSSDTQKILGEAFSKSLRTFHFDRNSQFTPRSLEEIRDKLLSVIENQESLIMTSKSVSSLLLKYVEHVNFLFKSGKNDDETAQLMREILEILSKRSLPLIDEADSVLNVLHEVSFSLGGKSAPKVQDGALIGALFELIYTDPELKSLVRLDSDPEPNQEARPFTKAVYHSTVKKTLAVKLIEKLPQLDLKNDSDTLELREFALNLSQNLDDKTKLIAYICRDENKIKEAQKYYDSLTPTLQNFFALAAEEISHLLPHTLSKLDNENYSVDDEIFAIPFDGPDNPLKGSVFNNPNVTMNYSFAHYYQNGISREIVVKVLSLLYRDADLESKESGQSIKLTKAYERFTKLIGEVDIPFTEYTDEQLLALVDQINSTPEKKKEMIVDEIFPRIEVFAEKLSCNPIMLINFFEKAFGFTGTLMSSGSMNGKLTPMPEIGTDAKTLVTLYRLMGSGIQEIQKGSLVSMIDSLSKKEISFDMISDAGGYFKQGGNLKVARDFANKFKKPVVFYNGKNEQTVTDGKQEMPLSESSLKEGDRLTFLDKSHTTGADVPQKINATAYVTIGRNMTLRDLFQAVWRLRSLGKGQKVLYLIDNEVLSIIKEKLKLEKQAEVGFLEILEFVIQNQCERQGDDNFKAFKQELFGMAQQILAVNILKDEIWPINRMAAFKVLRDLWIKRQDKSQAENYGIASLMRPKKEVLKEEGNKCRKILEDVKKKLPFTADLADESVNKIDELIERYTPRVHAQIISPIGDDSETVEVETETDVEVDVDVEVVVEDVSEKVNLGHAALYTNEDLTFKKFETYCKTHNLPCSKEEYGKWKQKWINGEKLPDGMPFHLADFIKGDGWGSASPHIISLEDQMKLQPELSEFAHLFSGINITKNVLEWKQEECEDSASIKTLFGSHRTPLQHLHVHGDEVTILTLIEQGYSNFNPYLGFTKINQDPSDEVFKKVVKIKFLRGECNYNKKELEFLLRWLEETNPLKFREFFLKVILKNRPDKQSSFSNTSLGRTFSKVFKNAID